MPRRQYVVTYDVSDDRRRDRIFKILHGFGDHTQYSVFFCEMNEAELSRLRSRLRDLVHHGEDQILIVDLGPATRSFSVSVQAIGRAYNPPTRTVVV